MICLIDDERDLPIGWSMWIRTGNVAVDWVTNLYDCNNRTVVKELWLDHDLGSNEVTGYDVASKLEELEYWRVNSGPFDSPQRKDCPIEKVFVHSMNPVGAKNIMKALAMFAPKRVGLAAEMDLANKIRWGIT